MGWVTEHATHRRKDGSVDRKAECDAYFLEGLNAGHYEVLKSAMVGSVYYAAVRCLLRYVGEDETGKAIYEPYEDAPVFAAVVLTRCDNRQYLDFSHKELSEDVGPGEAKCPLSILALLPTTDNEYALDWRKRCMEYAERNKVLSGLPVGAKIRIKDAKGNAVVLVKSGPAYQFKRPFWYVPSTGMYIKKNHIPESFEVLPAED